METDAIVAGSTSDAAMLRIHNHRVAPRRIRSARSAASAAMPKHALTKMT
jgi:hypothetical protein